MSPLPQECPICQELLGDPSAFDRAGYSQRALRAVFSLDQCNHVFHATCLAAQREASREVSAWILSNVNKKGRTEGDVVISVCLIKNLQKKTERRIGKSLCVFS